MTKPIHITRYGHLLETVLTSQVSMRVENFVWGQVWWQVRLDGPVNGSTPRHGIRAAVAAEAVTAFK